MTVGASLNGLQGLYGDFYGGSTSDALSQQGVGLFGVLAVERIDGGQSKVDRGPQRFFQNLGDLLVHEPQSSKHSSALGADLLVFGLALLEQVADPSLSGLFKGSSAQVTATVEHIVCGTPDSDV